MRHQSSINTNTQAGRILARLKKTPRKWVDMYELFALSGAYAVHSRISDLRKCGCRIECKIVGRGDGKTISFYRLMP